MKKSITREQIIETALDLMRDKKDLRSLNLREIARTLGCAHTNIYNYFSSYTDLLWETHTALQEVFMQSLRENLSAATTADIKLRHFFNMFLQIYIVNKGWFRLAWLEYIGDIRPESNKIAIQNTRLELNQYVIDIWEEITGITPQTDMVDRVLHNTHCYIIGEVSNYISGRGLIEDETELKNYIVSQAIYIFSLYMRG
ncbi:TetR/AcrR family transcriptional regulator [Alkalibaculum sp. M08DMB]|uniref:TetR/AcrR family transcriptional regulator n=1 Tax=Alkalibaculum sporogenes TaxID=2655001 RepID=A0A6A7K4R6_9FIRM|nr:TetR/AcrR family transcriptional regulator [Alkalibaculum sporogenes]MPW24304.1 TetR/AcrR family transcriptional regulator [Alkalibaculum sporogenes]